MDPERGRLLEKAVVLFTEQVKVHTLLTHQALDKFADMFAQQVSTLIKEGHLPPKDKGEADSEGGGGRVEKRVREEEEEESSMSSSSSSSHSSMPEDVRKAQRGWPKVPDDYDREDEFVASSSEEPEVYPEMALAPVPVAAAAKSKRLRKKLINENGMIDFLSLIADVGLPEAVKTSEFYKRKYGNYIDVIKRDMCRGQAASDIFDLMCITHLQDDEEENEWKPYVCNAKMKMRGHKVCEMCSFRTSCPRDFYLNKLFRPVCMACSTRLNAVIAFLIKLYDIQDTDPTPAAAEKAFAQLDKEFEKIK